MFKKISKYLLLAVLGAAIGIGFNILTTDAQQEEEPANKKTTAYGVELVTSEGQKQTEFLLPVAGRDEFDYAVKFTNGSQDVRDFSLQMMIDYLPVPFHLANDAAPRREHRFQVEPGQEIEIPVRFSLADLSPRMHELAFTIVAAPDARAKDKERVSSFSGIVSRYTLQTGVDGTFEQPAALAAVEQRPNPQGKFRGLLINQVFGADAALSKPDKQIAAKPNEPIRLALRAAGRANAPDQLVWLTLNGQPVQVAADEPYWHFTLPGHEAMAYREIEIAAPATPGDYELRGYQTGHPFGRPAAGGGPVAMVEMSHPITVHVE